jgi:ribosomal-protein-alanine N-acetyltransferase
MAEALFAQMCAGVDLSVEVASAGLAVIPGEPAASLMTQTARRFNLSDRLAAHRSKAAVNALLAKFDLIVCMSANHLHGLSYSVPLEKLRLLGGGIPDPFGGDARDYDICANQIAAYLPSILREISGCPCEIRAMTADDLPDVVRLDHLCFSVPWREEDLHRMFMRKEACALVAVRHGQAIAFAGASQVLDQADVSHIAVHPDWRKQGIANALLARMHVCLVMRGCHEIQLEVRQSNEAAIALYRRHGYTTVGCRKNYYTKPAEDAVLMTLMLF